MAVADLVLRRFPIPSFLADFVLRVDRSAAAGRAVAVAPSVPAGAGLAAPGVASVDTADAEAAGVVATIRGGHRLLTTGTDTDTVDCQATAGPADAEAVSAGTESNEWEMTRGARKAVQKFQAERSGI